MRKALRWATLPTLVLAAAACSDTSDTTGPGLDTESLTLSFDVETVSAEDITTVELLAGQDILVGYVSVTHNGDGTVAILYDMLAGYCLDEVHWEATYDANTLINNGGNPKIGQFAYGDDMLDCAPDYSETGDITGTYDGDYIVAAHAVVVGSEENPHVVYGTFDQEGDGAEEGDIYGINPISGNLTLVADIPNDANNDPYDPNGLAIDQGSEYLYFVSDKTLYKVPAFNADPSAVDPMMVAEELGGDGPIRNATIAGGFYWYVPNGTDELRYVALDGTGDDAYCSLGEPSGLYFGDIAADPDPSSGLVYGTARVGNGTSGDVVFFTVDLSGGAGSCTNDFITGTLDFQLQLAFGPDGTLYGQQAISEPEGDDPGQWYVVDPATGTISEMLAQTDISFTDIAGGLPFVPVEFEETAWADGERFTERGSWATFLGPFSLE